MATVNKDFRVKNGLVVEGTTATVNGENILTEGSTTDVLNEGTTNLYFTDQRAVDAVTNNVDTDGIDEGTTNLYFTEDRVTDALVNTANVLWVNISAVKAGGVLTITADAGLDDSTTDNLDEGTINLYFTDQRAIDAVVNGSVDTDDIEEGTTNLYFTDQRAIDAVVNGAVDSDDIEEGTINLYFTQTRARESISAGTGINYSSTDGIIYVDTDEIATRQYVDATTEGLHIHASVSAATDEPLADTISDTVTYDNLTGTLTLDTALTELDGVTLTNGMRILVKNESEAGGEGAAANGIYTWATGGTVLTRADDYNTAEEIQGGDFVFVTGGTKYNSTGWVQIDNVTTLGTDPIEWEQFSGAGTFTGGTGININGEEISIDFTEFDTDDIDEGTVNLFFTDQRAVDAVIAAVDTDDIDEGTINLYFTDQRAIDAVVNGSVTSDDIEEGTINLYYTDQRVEGVIDSLTTDNLSEGTLNLYYTNQKVYNALASSVQSNISITTTDGLLYVNAENGVEDSITDNLDEGTINLYFTNQRAVDALEAIVPNFEAVEFDSIAKTFAVQSTVTTAEVATQAYTFAHATYRSAKLTVKFAYGNHTEISEVLLTLDSSENIAITEYAIVSTNGSLGNITAALDGDNIDINVTVANNSTDVKIFGTLIV